LLLEESTVDENIIANIQNIRPGPIEPNNRWPIIDDQH